MSDRLPPDDRSDGAPDPSGVTPDGSSADDGILGDASLDDVSLDDTAVSAFVDGAATDDERARVAADPALAARVDRWREIGAVIASAPEPPAGLADLQVDAALAAFGAAADDPTAGNRDAGDPARPGPDQGLPVTADGRTAAPVESLAAARAQREHWSRRIPLGAVAAAVVLIALVGAITQIDIGDRAQDTAATTTADADLSADAAASAEESITESSPDTTAAERSDGSGVPAAAGSSSILADDLAGLETAIRNRMTAPAAATTGGSGMSDPSPSEAGSDGTLYAADCDPIAAAGATPDEVLERIDAVVADEAVIVVRTPTEDGGNQFVVVDVATCAVVDDFVVPSA